jgi:PAS domain S-box-containing protein
MDRSETSSIHHGQGARLLALPSVIPLSLLEAWNQYQWYALGLLVVLGLQAYLIAMLLLERARRKRAHDALRAASKVFDSTGEVYFRSLTEHLNAVLNVDYVAIGELMNSGTRMKTVAVSAGGKNIGNMEYDLEDTPCEKVLQLGHYFDTGDVQSHFSKGEFLVELGVRSYLGVALVDSSGSRIGVMSVMTRRPFKDSWVAELTLSLFAARTSVEMERRRSEQALDSSQARNRAILEAIPDVVLLLDSAGNVLDYSANNRNEFYTPREEIVGKNIRETFPGGVATGITHGFQRALSSGAPSSLDFSVANSGGFSFYEARAVPLDAHKALTIIRNVTDRKQAEFELEKNRHFFEKIAKTMPGVLFIFDLQTRRNVYVNQGGWGVLGYSDEEVMEMGEDFLPRTMHHDDLSRLPQLAEQYAKAADNVILKHLFRMRHRNGEWRWILRHATIFTRTSDGHPEQLIGTATDITDLKHAELELQQLSARLLTAQDQERRRIARNLHDRTAQNIFAVRINLRQLEEQSPPSPLTSKMFEECQRLCDVSLQEIRTLSYLLHPPMLEQGGLIPAVRWLVEGFADRSGLEISLETSKKWERLPAEVERELFLILQEALANVVRHSGSNNAVVHLERLDGEVVLQVRDSGRGMPAATELKDDGFLSTGVGIPSMRERLRHIGGRLEIQSTDQGTVVSAKVPVSADSADEARPTAAGQ